MVAEHIFATKTNHLWKDCNPKYNTFLTEYTKQIYSADYGRTDSLLA